MRFILAFLFFLIAVPTVFGQSVNQAKAEKLMIQAHEYIRLKKYEKAEQTLVNCLKVAPSRTEIYSTLAFLYINTHQYAKAADVFQQAARSCAQCAQAFALPMAEALCKSQQYSQAAEVLKSWQKPKNISKEIEQ